MKSPIDVIKELRDAVVQKIEAFQDKKTEKLLLKAKLDDVIVRLEQARAANKEQPNITTYGGVWDATIDAAEIHDRCLELGIKVPAELVQYLTQKSMTGEQKEQMGALNAEYNLLSAGDRKKGAVRASFGRKADAILEPQ
jgi:hypothetical protein